MTPHRTHVGNVGINLMETDDQPRNRAVPGEQLERPPLRAWQGGEIPGVSAAPCTAKGTRATLSPGGSGGGCARGQGQGLCPQQRAWADQPTTRSRNRESTSADCPPLLPPSHRGSQPQTPAVAQEPREPTGEPAWLTPESRRGGRSWNGPRSTQPPGQTPLCDSLLPLWLRISNNSSISDQRVVVLVSTNVTYVFCVFHPKTRGCREVDAPPT